MAGEGTADAPADMEGRKATPAPTWHKAPALKLWPEATAEDALAAAIGNALAHWSGNEACVIARAHPEGVHQMRVATRRLRSRLDLYKPQLPEANVKPVQKELKWLISQLGPARDWDVFLQETWQPVADALPEETDLTLLGEKAERRRDKGYGKAAAALASRRYRELGAHLSAWATERSWRQAADVDEAHPALQEPARAFASRVIEDRHGAVVTLGRSLADMDAETRHKLRIQIKKLRYAVEFFRSLYSENAVKPFVSALSSLQDSLGTMNDLAVARDVMDDLCARSAGRTRARLAFASGVIVGWHLPRMAAASPLNGSWAAFEQLPPFWDDSATASGDARPTA